VDVAAYRAEPDSTQRYVRARTIAARARADSLYLAELRANAPDVAALAELVEASERAAETLLADVRTNRGC
jgi:hypothetical protein